MEVLGVDRDGRIAVSTQHGFFVLDPNTSTVVATYAQPRPIVGAAFCPSHNVVGLLGGDHTDDGLYTIRW